MSEIIRISENTSSGKDTWKHKGYQKAFMEACMINRPARNHLIVDLFARTCPWGHIRNDINQSFFDDGYTTHHDDALEFLRTFTVGSIDILLLDPPFSDRMNKDKYVGRANLYTDPKYMSDLGKEIKRVLAEGGVVVKAGFNSNAPSPDLHLVKVFLSHYGACRNDVMYSVWVNTQWRLSFD
jgi:hypothetical protein